MRGCFCEKDFYFCVCVPFCCNSRICRGGVKTYQVTGPVLEVASDMIVVQKGKDKWQIGRDAATKLTGDLKVGSKVTIEYTMKAVTIEAKEVKKK